MKSGHLQRFCISLLIGVFSVKKLNIARGVMLAFFISGLLGFSLNDHSPYASNGSVLSPEIDQEQPYQALAQSQQAYNDHITERLTNDDAEAKYSFYVKDINTADCTPDG